VPERQIEISNIFKGDSSEVCFLIRVLPTNPLFERMNSRGLVTVRILVNTSDADEEVFPGHLPMELEQVVMSIASGAEANPVPAIPAKLYWHQLVA